MARPDLAVHASISSTLLLPQDRIPRAPLGEWSEQLGRRLGRCRAQVRSVPDHAGDVAGIANNTGLIAAQQGSLGVAWRVCELQIVWHGRFGRRAGDPSVVRHGLQPWVNLGRLEALRGDWGAALARFAQLRASEGATPSLARCLGLTATLWQEAAPSEPGRDQLLVNIYVIDSLKALLLNREFGEVLEFAARLGDDIAPGLRRFADEASVVALSRLGEVERAEALALAVAREERDWRRAVFRLRLAEVRACGGDREGATAVLHPLAGVMAQLSPTRCADLQSLYVLVRVASACREVGLDEDAEQVARVAYAGAREANDEVFQIESLRILAASPGPERDALTALEETTEYRRYRRKDLPHEPSDSVRRLYDQVTEFLAG